MSEELPTCFVIQEFDEGSFDRRYRETFAPALARSGVKPVRGDEILGVQPIISKIEDALKDGAIVVAEVSTDNPTVWLELGFALAFDRPCVILCDKGIRSRLPFDIQHRPVIFYRTDSASGFTELEKDIERHVRHEINTERRVKAAPYSAPVTQLLKISRITKLLSSALFLPSGLPQWAGSQTTSLLERSRLPDTTTLRLVWVSIAFWPVATS